MKPVENQTPVQTTVAATAADETSGATEFVEEELLLEEISIDGMCGVY